MMDSAEAYRLALEKRQSLQIEARGFGIDETFVGELVEQFYRKVRIDPDLGPVFERVIKNNWDPHLAKMKLFWESVILRSGDYKGKPMKVHRKVIGGEPEHFAIWLRLFEETLNEIAPSEEAKAQFLERARFMAPRLKLAMFGENS